MFKFNKYHVLNTDNGAKARVFYCLDNRADGRKCVTLYHRDYNNNLANVGLSGYENDTDSQTDYFDQGCARLFEDHPQYAAARQRAEANKAEKHPPLSIKAA